MEEDWQEENEPEQQQQGMDEDDDDDDDDEEDILGGDDEPQTDDKESLLMRFCPHDSSMLYPEVCRKIVLNAIGGWGYSLLFYLWNDNSLLGRSR